MSWVAFDRAIRLAERRGLPSHAGRWAKMCEMVYRQITERGFHPKREAFVQQYDTDVLDASLLYMPLVGLVSPSDLMWQSMLRAMDQELVSDSLVCRDDPADERRWGPSVALVRRRDYDVVVPCLAGQIVFVPESYRSVVASP